MCTCVSMHTPTTKNQTTEICIKHDHNLQLLWYQIHSDRAEMLPLHQNTENSNWITCNKTQTLKILPPDQGATQGPVPGSMLVIRCRFSLCHHVLYNLLKHIDIHSNKTNNGLYNMIHSTWGSYMDLNYSWDRDSGFWESNRCNNFKTEKILSIG